jgi:asparagine synthetase B (glutamine-hydrolysing)
MCGINGIHPQDQKSRITHVLTKMRDSLVHRPDGVVIILTKTLDFTIDSSILDLSSGGNQPYISEDKQICNGL